ncbi:hypothetical protein F0L74_27125 [Chitinophaga agrisoli]|uniref:Uncharacterized protein n=1 Tax=Chitinophaga agrisoli TaxID=2607653 RepID=A0A5B2VNH3_9BACT|nr:class I lanthipeptide [Chitinophaga agrisoli]KAA2239862.1 hypothetical protein F0L74_27125 [Chitinophaga agrisoli]
MKKRKLDLGKKLLLNKEKVASLSNTQQAALVGGFATVLVNCSLQTVQISLCRATSPAPGRPCCQIP